MRGCQDSWLQSQEQSCKYPTGPKRGRTGGLQPQPQAGLPMSSGPPQPAFLPPSLQRVPHTQPIKPPLSGPTEDLNSPHLSCPLSAPSPSGAQQRGQGAVRRGETPFMPAWALAQGV